MRSRPKTPGRVLAQTDERLSPAGRPRKGPPAGAAAAIRKAAASGATQMGVAMALGTCVDVLKRWFEEDPELKDAFDEGRELERAALHGVLHRMATKGKGRDALIASMFLLKSKHGYREGDQESQANRVAITFSLPGALPLDKFTVIENGTAPTQPLPAKITRGS
jgi:hypothetical protein